MRDGIERGFWEIFGRVEGGAFAELGRIEKSVRVEPCFEEEG